MTGQRRAIPCGGCTAMTPEIIQLSRGAELVFFTRDGGVEFMHRPDAKLEFTRASLSPRAVAEDHPVLAESMRECNGVEEKVVPASGLRGWLGRTEVVQTCPVIEAVFANVRPSQFFDVGNV